MKIDTIVLYAVAALAGIAAVIYVAALVFGVVRTGGLLLPALIVFLAVIAVVVTVIRQRLGSREDDYYDTIEK